MPTKRVTQKEVKALQLFDGKGLFETCLQLLEHGSEAYVSTDT